jgi:hypothetical protein
MPNKAPALKKRKREKLDAELESGPQVDQQRDAIMQKMLATPPRRHSEKKCPKPGGDRANPLPSWQDD